MSSTGEPSWLSMTIIERVRFFHSRFVENGETKSFEFMRQCAMQLQMPGCGIRTDKQVVTAYNNYYQLAYRTGRVWRHVEAIFEMWENREGYDEAVIIPVLEKVVSKELSLKDMAREFAKYKLEYMVRQAFVRALDEKNWSQCKINFKKHATDDFVKAFAPLFKGWKDPAKAKRPFTAELTEFPGVFNQHIRLAQTWYQKKKKQKTGWKTP
ncbi:unnamed protein product [Calypogeia fissa]